MTNHTPGPWFNNDTQLDIRPIKDGLLGDPVALVSHTNPNGKADASLIAASPDLLDALKAFVAPWNEGRRFQDMDVDDVLRLQERANAAIAKAEGR